MSCFMWRRGGILKMSVTENLLSELKDLVNQVVALGNEYSSEVTRHQKKLSDLSINLSESKKRRQQEADKRIKAYKTSLNTYEQGIQNQRDEVQKLEAQLKRYYKKSKVAIPPVTATKFDEKEARALLERIRETGFWAWVKKVLALGKYKTNSAMATDLYSQIANAYLYLDSCVKREREKCSLNVQAETAAMQKDIKQIETQNSAAVSSEKAVHSSKSKSIEQAKQNLISNRKISNIASTISSEFLKLGGKDEGWNKYVPSNSIPTDLLVGIICVPSGIAVPNQVQKDVLKTISCYNSKINCFVVPMTASTGKPLLIYSETDGSDVYHQAEIFRSIVLRQLRFMPPKSIKVSYIDPVNRGTTLGQLSHLYGEDACNVCIPFLDSQDISKEIKNLKLHVDKVCDKLTKSGHPSVYAYNRSNNSDKIPYRTIVINDFPVGFDSQSLEDLQVLMNKSSQCGISIMISRKKVDKLENKALDAVRKTESLFIQHRVNGGKSDTVNFGTLYGFKPFCNTIPNSYFDEINERYNYKAPIVNEYTKFFNVANLPAYRSSAKELSIPFAVDKKGNMIDFILNYKTLPYGFITGSIGSGKSTLLHTLITSAVLHYHPDELEMWLVDFKETEFAFYTHCCPHQIRYVAANESGEIAYSVMDEIVAELRRRKEAFKSVNAVDFVDYRKNHKMPRLLVIIDEFHRMSQAAADSDNYKIVLENIVAEARSHGVSLLFCDQMISAGLSGLTPKAKSLFTVRLAMRNKETEIRETLEISPQNLTDGVKEIINETSSGLEGSLIYKKETKNEKDSSALSNKVDYVYCRAMYFAQKSIQEEFIKAANARVGVYDRSKVFFVNAKREHMDTKVIADFEKRCPVDVREGERYYIGSALGLKPCFYFNLKNASAENILMVGNDDDKRLSLIKSIVTCALHNKKKVVFLISKTAQLYSQNKDFFKEGNGVTVYSSFPDICKFIGEKSNILKKMGEEDDFSVETEPTLVICIGLDDIFEKMENSTLSQEQAWKISAGDETTTSNLSTNNQKAPSLRLGLTFNPKPLSNGTAADSEKRGTPRKSIDDIVNGIATRQEKLEGESASFDAMSRGAEKQKDLLHSITSRQNADEESASSIRGVTDSFSGPSEISISGYRATSDLANIICNGWKIDINTLIVLDKSTAYNEMKRPLKLADNFNHRIATRMSPDAASDFMAKTISMKALNDKDDQTSAIYENMGGREQCFRPYSL